MNSQELAAKYGGKTRKIEDFNDTGKGKGFVDYVTDPNNAFNKFGKASGDAAKRVAGAFVKAGATGVAAVDMTQKAIRGDLEGADKVYDEGYNVPGFGKVVPNKIGGRSWKDENTFNRDTLKTVGTGAQIGATIGSSIAFGGMNPAGIIQGMGTGAVVGGTSAGLDAAGAAIQDDSKSVTDAFIEGALAVPFGAAFGTLFGGYKGYMAQVPKYNQQVKDFFSKHLEPKEAGPVAKTNLPGGNKFQAIKADPKAIAESNKRLGEPITDLVVNADDTDKQAMKQILTQIKKNSKDTMVANVKNPSDSIVGKTITDKVDDIWKGKTATGKALTESINKMPNKLQDVTQVRDEFLDELKNIHKVKIRVDGTLDFSKSTLANVPSAQKMIINTYNDLVPNKAGLVMRTPKNIYTITKKQFNDLGYAKGQQDLVPAVQVTIDKVRKGLNSVLDDLSPQGYAIERVKYAQAMDVLKDYYRLMGKNFSGEEAEILQLRASEVAQKLLGSNTADTLNVITKMNDAQKLFGFKPKGDVIRQAFFLDAAKDIYQVVGPKSIAGQVKKGATSAVMEGADVLKDVATQNWGGLALKQGGKFFGKITSKQQQAALEALLGL